MSDKYKDFLSSFAGRELMRKYRPSHYSFWRIRGGDTNADFSGPHYMPELGIVEGRLDDVINFAVLLPNFWAWGPGDIIAIDKPRKIDKNTSKEREERITKIAQLEAELAQLKKLDN